jgi:hypothetical protein
MFTPYTYTATRISAMRVCVCVCACMAALLTARQQTVCGFRLRLKDARDTDVKIRLEKPKMKEGLVLRSAITCTNP